MPHESWESESYEDTFKISIDDSCYATVVAMLSFWSNLMLEPVIEIRNVFKRYRDKNVICAIVIPVTVAAAYLVKRDISVVA